MFEVLKRDGAARIGSLTIGDKTVHTPTMFFLDHERFPIDKGELSRDLCIEISEGRPYLENQLLNDRVEIFRGRKIRGDPAEVAARLVNMREEAGYSKALYIPGTGLIHDHSLMVYSGVDVFDISLPILYARKGYYLTEYGPVTESEWSDRRCSCPACISDEKGFTKILRHNHLASTRELAIIREFITRGQLRHLVEMRTRTRPESVAILRHLDRRHYPFFRKRIPFVGGGVKGVSSDTLRSPDVKYYRERLEGYKKPGGNVLLLLPCSARKPYSTSKSHKLFSSVTLDFRGPLHEVIVTSPLGIVPRELEGFFPAADYDISVTGEWSGEEKEIVKGMLSSLLRDNEYSRIINHTPYEFVSEFLVEQEAMNTVVDGRSSSIESLETLRKALLETTVSIQPISYEVWKKGVFRNMWRFQFGNGTENIVKGMKVKGRYPFLKLFDGEQMAMFVPQSRRISLTLNGGELLSELEINRVFIGDFHPSGDIFSVGIEDADPGIVVGCEVVVVHGDQVRAVGVAIMNSEEMVEAKRGLGVKIRHRKKYSG